MSYSDDDEFGPDPHWMDGYTGTQEERDDSEAMGVIRWEEPPAAQSGGKGVAKNVIAHELIAVQLRRKPGQWGVVHEGRSLNSIARAIKTGDYAPYRPGGSFESTTRWQNDKLVTFARYVGPGQ